MIAADQCNGEKSQQIPSIPFFEWLDHQNFPFFWDQTSDQTISILKGRRKHCKYRDESNGSVHHKPPKKEDLVGKKQEGENGNRTREYWSTKAMVLVIKNGTWKRRLLNKPWCVWTCFWQLSVWIKLAPKLFMIWRQVFPITYVRFTSEIVNQDR